MTPAKPGLDGQSAGVDMGEELMRLGGVATCSELLALTARRGLRRAVEEGVVLRVGRGRYALPTVAEAEAAAIRVGGVVSHLSAAMHHEWKVQFPPTRPVVTVPRWRTLSPERRRGIDVRWADLGKDDRDGIATSKERTLVDCARTEPWPAGLAVADSALRGGMSPAVARLWAESAPRVRRARALRVADAADGRAANPFESVLRAICLEVPGLQVEPQFTITGVGRVDLADLRLSLVIEAESFEFHATPEGFAKDIRRYTALVAQGWTVIRFTWAEVMHEPAWVRHVLTALVERGPDPRALLPMRRPA